MSGAGPDRHLRRVLARIAAAAAQAPSKHNTQPWRFLVHEAALEVWPDPARVLPETDPHRRELVLACGAAAQTALVLAQAEGLDVAVDVLPEGTAGAVVRLRVQGTHPVTARHTALATAVAGRHTDRGPLDSAGLPAQAALVLQDAASLHGAQLVLITGEQQRAALARLLLEADHELAGHRFVTEEVTAWTRRDDSRSGDGVPSGSSRGAAASHGARFVQRDFTLPGTRALHDRPGPDEPLIAVLTSPGDEVEDWVAAGRALAQVLLEAQLLGGTASFLNQVVEVERTRQQVRRELGVQGWPQVVLRLGVGGPVRATARRPVDDTVVQVL